MKVLHTVTELVATAVQAAPDVSGAGGHLEVQSVEEQSRWWFWRRVELVCASHSCQLTSVVLSLTK